MISDFEKRCLFRSHFCIFGHFEISKNSREWCTSKRVEKSKWAKKGLFQRFQRDKRIRDRNSWLSLCKNCSLVLVSLTKASIMESKLCSCIQIQQKEAITKTIPVFRNK
jgi:hypothetical protein